MVNTDVALTASTMHRHPLEVALLWSTICAVVNSVYWVCNLHCEGNYVVSVAHLNTSRPAKLFGHGKDGHTHADSIHIAQQQGQSSGSDYPEECQGCRPQKSLYRRSWAANCHQDIPVNS